MSARDAGEAVWREACARVRAGDRGTWHHQAVYALPDEAHAAARGATSIGAADVILSGFDPFARGGPWNPSGAAVMALHGAVVAGWKVACVVHPVSYAQFDRGIVEAIVAAHAARVAAFLTVSMSPSTPGDAPMRLERYAVNVHDRCDLIPHPSRPEPTDRPGLEPIIPGGPLVIDAGQVVYDVARETGSTVGEDLRHDEAGNLVAGPGGNFLSNESAYRTQRELRARGSRAASFHIHTPGADTTTEHVVAAIRAILNALRRS